LSEECGNIIRQVEASGELKTLTKGDNSPVTIADLKVQKTIETCLLSLYPSLNIQGEESKDSIEEINSAV
jgi:3'-phosphoadenosine 5'-phosphosulfate (PAPS) 3'-phosphatase